MSKAKEFIIEMYNEHKLYRKTLEDIAEGKHGVCEHVINARAALNLPAKTICVHEKNECHHVLVSVYKIENIKKLFSSRTTQVFDFMYCSKCGQAFDTHGEPVYAI